VGINTVSAAPDPAVATAGAPADLSRGWGNYQACLVKPGGSVECFTSSAKMKSRSTQLRTMSAATWCPVNLYDGGNYTGRVLQLSAEGYWMNLADYGFDKATVSFIGSGCGFHLAEGAWGGGWWYPGYTGTWASAPDMGNWNWRTSSVYIN
jgi:hypothetical protein